MASVVDANLLVVLASGDPRATAAEALINRWIENGEPVHAPALLSYEVANGLTRLVVAGRLPADRLAEAWQKAMSLPMIFHPQESGEDEVAALAVRLGRQSAYDAAYLVLAQQLGAELWTLDGPLARNARGLGCTVHLVT